MDCYRVNIGEDKMMASVYLIIRTTTVAAAALLLLTTSAAAAGWSSACQSSVALLPRGGGAILTLCDAEQRAVGFRRGKSANDRQQDHNDVATAGISTKESSTSDDGVDGTLSSDDNDDSTTQEVTTSPFQRAYQEEADEIKKSQQFIQKQQLRRDLDKTWLDKGITAVIEFLENIFRWEVID